MEVKICFTAFVLGIMVDLVLANPLGVSSTLFLVVIFLYGVVRRFI
ncbi:MAG: rod shape-determining protein MreD [Patescibacteria group bacterium]